MNKIQFRHKAGPFGDCTSDYEVCFPENMTVYEFIVAVLEEYPEEWGSFFVSWLGNIGITFMKYKAGDIVNICDKECFLKIKDYHIKKVSANGGWSLMDYYITTKEREELPNNDISHHQFKN